MIVQHADWLGCLPKSNDERRAEWSQLYFGGGFHRNPTYSEGENYALEQCRTAGELDHDS